MALPPAKLERSDAGFPKTRWSLVDLLVQGDMAQRQEALGVLALTYWPAIYASLRQRGKSRNEAQELTQAFFAEIVMGRQLFEQADINRGSLRNLLLVALKRFLIDQHRRTDKPTFRFQVPVEEISQEDEALQEDVALDPDTLFDRRWAVAVLEEALKRCEKHFCSTGKKSHWDAFDMRVIKPSLGTMTVPSHEQIADTLGLSSADDSVSAIRVVRKRLQAILWQVIAETTPDVSEQQLEYQSVLKLLS